METIHGLKPGTTLRHGTYRIERILGQGGFGITYLATDLTLDRLVAIKEFFPKDFCDREGDTSHVTFGTRSTGAIVNQLKAKFLKEARNIAKFDNPGIIRIFTAFEENNTAYYIMEYIEGTTLSDIVKHNGPMSPDWALYYIDKVGEALDFVHSHHMNHLDVKPANIMVRAADYTPVLIDFGLSKQYDSQGNQTSMTPTGISPGYAPLEQYYYGGVSEFSPQTDLYSLAATLYYLLTGVVPPPSMKLVDQPLPIPSSIPRYLVNPIMRAMSTTRLNRHENIREFLNEIHNPGKVSDNRQNYVKPNPAGGGSQYGPAYEDKAPARNRTLLKVIFAVLAILIVGGGILWLFSGKNGDDAAVESPESEKKETVTGMFWESPLGVASYTGEAAPDSLNQGMIVPDGKGVARISGGEYTGCVYDGEFVNGRMEGKSVYTLKNGDVFEGTFLNNEFGEGRYTIKETGKYFVGKFRNMQPDNGDWFDKTGNKIVTSAQEQEVTSKTAPKETEQRQSRTYNYGDSISTPWEPKAAPKKTEQRRSRTYYYGDSAAYYVDTVGRARPPI